MNGRHHSLWSPAIGAEASVLAYGHWGRPLLAFPSQQGPAWQYEERGMIDAIGDLIEAGRVKVYAVDSYDSGSWYRDGLSLEERAQQHGRYEDWIVNQVVPFIRADSSDDVEIAVTGVSFGAYHAANFALRHADLFPLAICHSGVYDVSVVADGQRDSAWRRGLLQQPGRLRLAPRRRPPRLAARPGQPAADLRPGRLGGLDGRAREHEALRAQLGEKGIRHELDVWGHDVPHDWPAWRAQIAHHLPRFV